MGVPFWRAGQAMGRSSRVTSRDIKGSNRRGPGHGRFALGALLGVAAAACGASPEPVRLPAPSGPPHVQPHIVRKHAVQFDDKLPTRPAGSQNEELAATYIVAHLQKAGYVVFLDAVPVANQVRSTNVVALPPSGREPSVLVGAPYDRVAGTPRNGAAIGLLLELARALRVRDRKHSFEFAALGAERTTISGGHLGSRRMAQLLRDRGWSPLVVTLSGVSADSSGPLSVEGGDGGRITDIARRLGISLARVDTESGSITPREVFARAGFKSVAVGGNLEDVARVLLELSHARRDAAAAHENAS